MTKYRHIDDPRCGRPRSGNDDRSFVLIRHLADLILVCAAEPDQIVVRVSLPSAMARAPGSTDTH
jgi:hypothetical protein